MRTGLKLPFAVLSDSKLELAKGFGLIGHEKPGEPTPATLVLDDAGRVQMSTLNEGAKSVFARDTFDYVLALKQGAPAASVAAPKVESPKPGFLFFKALANKAASLVIR
jgi:alkyl hydroperoxide reductase subunit AhpC